MRKAHASEHNLRSAVEATIRSLKHPFGNHKLPVRGHPRMSMMMVAGAAMTNIRRIWRKSTTPPAAQPIAAAALVADLITDLFQHVAFCPHFSPAFA